MLIKGLFKSLWNILKYSKEYESDMVELKDLLDK